nr:MAG TPA: hypothetical protein [Caudoviricetes sp.]
MIPTDDKIPEGSVEIQTGLWLYSYKKTISGTEYTFNQLFSAKGYYFYDNTLPEEERIYYKWMVIGTGTPDTSIYTSIPKSELPDNSNIA